MVGHSVGEFVAACLATRARIMQAMPAGAMLAVRLPERELAAEFDDRLDVAAISPWWPARKTPSTRSKPCDPP